MVLEPKQRLGPYEILAAVGAGGMGEVYRARDTRLDRIVAIKVLPDSRAARPDLRERFEREARTIASLNHPHICTLYDIGSQDGIDYLVMEYLEGETLAEHLKKGPLLLSQTLQYAIEIADALDKAHRKGITHRDLKPSNIMLTKSGTKLLDFGLAKLRQENAPPNISLSKLPTANDAITQQGTILGTLQYMAPEQLEGKEADARTDIFAFGVLVYEMATGKKAFEGKSQASVIARILDSDPPPISSLQPMTPPALDRAVKKCLAKEPEDRWQSAKDLTDELKWTAEEGSRVSSQSTASERGIRALGRRGLFVGAGAMLLAAAVASLATWNLKPVPPPQPVTRTVITLPPGQQLAALYGGPAIALSPDGTHLAYVARQGGVQQLYLRAMNGLEAKPMPGTEDATSPFFSPDGQWLGFFATGQLKKVSVSGGPAVTIGDAATPFGASWSSQGTIAFGLTTNSGLMQLPDSRGGTSQLLTRLGNGDVSHRWPEFLPGGKAMLFAAATTGLTFTNAQVAIQPIGKAAPRNLVPGTQPRFAPSGHLLYAQGGTLMAVPFDSQRLTVVGAGVPVVEGILQSTAGAAQYSISATGSLVYVPGGLQSAQLQLVWVNRNGMEQPLAAPARSYTHPRFSPDGRRIAAGILGQESQTWVYDLARDTLTRLTFEGTYNPVSAWTPDGKRIAIESNKDGPPNIFLQRADGSGGLERLTHSENIQVPVSWSPDGQLLAFFDFNPAASGADIWVLRMSDRKVQPFLRTRFNEAAPRFSPDGHWLAYISDESGRYEVYVQPYPVPGGKWQISTEGGGEPAWNPNGRELFYRNGDKMMAVEIATQPGFAAGKPRTLFEGRYELAPAVLVDNYDVSPDGQRFLMLKPAEQEQATLTQIVVVQNWFEELKQKVPTGKK